MPDLQIKKNNWENLDLKSTKIPEIVRNNSDEEVIKSYLNNNKSKLSDKEIDFLNHRISSMKLINSKLKEVNKQIKDDTYIETKTTLKANPDKESFILTSIKQPSFQTADNGCWSCFYQMLLQSRGIKDLTQEDIRAYRPALSKNSHGFGNESDLEMNTDSRINAIDMGDLATGLVPDSMLKSTEIWSFNKLKGNNGTPEEKKAYFDAAKSGIKKIIIEAIRDHKSPVGLMMDGHYITITGIEGDVISYKNSMPTTEAGNNPDYTFKENLSDLINSALNGINADALTLTWMEDIEVLKSNTIVNLPLTNVELENHLSFNNTLYTDRIKYTAKENQAMFKDDRHQNGTVICATGGIDIDDADAEYRFHLNDGFFRIDKAYLPDKVNSKRLLRKAERRSNEQEERLKTERNNKLKKIEDIEHKITKEKLNSANAAPIPVQPEKQSFKIKVKYTGRPFFGDGNFVDFKNTMNAMGWDKDKYPTLLSAFANVYDVFPLDKMPNHKLAMDTLFTNSFISNFNSKNSITALKKTLEDFLYNIKNGGAIYDDMGIQQHLKGINTLRDIDDNVAVSLTYLEKFIETLNAIEFFAPDLNPDAIDIESFIDNKGNILYNEIKNNEIIKSNVGYGALNDSKGTRIAHNCKYRIKNQSYSYNEAEKLLIDMDKVPVDARDKDLYFTLLLTLAYPDPGSPDKKVVFNDNDYIYLAERYSEDSEFAGNIDDIINYGYSTLWAESAYLSRYIFNKDRNLYGDSTGEKAEVLTDKKKAEAATGFKDTIKSAKNDWSMLNTAIKDHLTKEEANFDTSLTKIQNDLILGNKTFEPVAFDKNSTINYVEAAKIIAVTTIPAKINAVPDKYMLNVNARMESSLDRAIRERNETIALKAKTIANSFDFVMYIKEKADSILKMTCEEFVNDYDNYRTAAYNKVKQDIDDVTSFTGNQDYELNKASIVNNSNLLIAQSVNDTAPFNREDMVRAADLVIAKTLLTKRADTMFYSKVMIDDIIEPNMIAFRIKEARNELINDQVFLETFAKRLPAKDFYKEYTKALNLETNRKIKAENARKKDIRKTRGEEARINQYLETHNHKITDKQAKELVESYNNMLEYNKGKSPSSAMEKLMKAFKDVIDEMGVDASGRNIQMMKLHKLNKYVLKYYDKRQGIFHDPYTDMGKARLKEIEKLSVTTAKIVDTMRKETPDINNSKPKKEAGNIKK